MKAALYEVWIDGVLPDHELAEFGNVSARHVDGQTVLIGLLRDQPALLGLVRRVEALGLTVLALHPLVRFLAAVPR